MPKYWGGNYFAHGRFPGVGQNQKTEERERKKERLNDGNNNGHAMHGARKQVWRTQAKIKKDPKYWETNFLPREFPFLF